MKFNYDGNEIDLTLDETHLPLMKWAETNKTFKEEPFLRFLRDNEIITSDSVVMDIGSFIGNHVVYYSKIIGVKKVIAFEPTKRSYNILKENIEKNEVTNIHTFNVAIASKVGFAKCEIRKATNPAKNKWYEVNESDDECVLSMCLNDFELEPIDFIKIDVEGMELKVLKGGLGVIEVSSPVLMIEVMKENLLEFEILMSNLNYKRFGEDVFTLHRHKKANTLLYKRNY